MDHDHPFFQQILADLDNPAPRLMYADWLEERGDARGEFIRLQCECETLSEFDPRRHDLEPRIHDLQQQHFGEWAHDLIELGVGVKSFRRGFIEEVCCMTETFLEIADLLWTVAPTVRGLHLFDAKPELARLADTPQLNRAASLSLRQSALDSDDLHALARSPHLGDLRRLDLSINAIGDDGMTAFMAPGLTNLEVLNLRNNHLRSGAMETLANLSSLAGLTTLLLRGNRIGPDGMESLSQTTDLSSLVVLDLGENRLTAESVTPLSGADGLSQLRGLDLRNNSLRFEGLIVLLTFPGMASIQQLNLSANGLGDQGARRLSDGDEASSLTHLDLSANHISDRGAEELAQSRHLDNLTALELSGNWVTPGGAQAILESDRLPNLHRLRLKNPDWGPQNKDWLQQRFGERLVLE